MQEIIIILQQPDEIDIKKVYINSYITEENEVVNINKRIIPNNPKPSISLGKNNNGRNIL